MAGKCIVYMAVYNGKAFVQRTLDSLLAQTYKDFIIYITDDCSDLDTYEVLEKYRERNPDKIIVNRNQYNQGVGYNSHKCFVDYHDGDYAGIIGHDDIWEPDYLNKMIASLKESDAVAAFGRVTYINAANKPINANIFRHEEVVKKNRYELLLELLRGNFLCAPSAVLDMTKLDRASIAEYWGYNNDRLQDHELWMNLICFGAFTYVEEANCYYRLHQNNLSNISKRIVQGQLEFYGQIRRLLYSPWFLEFAKAHNNFEHFIVEVLQRIEATIGYSNPLKILVMDFCEKLLNEGFDFLYLKDTLARIYQDMGALTKAIKGGYTLPVRQRLVACASLKNDNVEYIRKNSKHFEIIEGFENISMSSMCLVDSCAIEYMMNQSGFLPYLTNNQVVLFCRNGEEVGLSEKYPKVLIIRDNVYQPALDYMILSYIEDHTHIYGNSFFLRWRNQEANDTKITICAIKIEDRVPRYILWPKDTEVAQFVDQNGIEISIVSHGQNAEKNYEYILTEKKECRVLCAKLSREAVAPKTIIINNELYILDSITLSQGVFIGTYSRICFYESTQININNGITEILLAENKKLQQQYESAMQSRAVRYGLKIGRVIRKLRGLK